MVPPRSDDRDGLDDEDLPALLDDLDRTLSALRSELERRDEDAPRCETDDRGRESRRRRRRDRGPLRPPRPFRPPSVSELFRFTEQHTIPTVIATLEATIQSLELLRGVLRLADPERSAFDADGEGGRDASTAARLGSGVTGLGRGAVSGAERALSELQTALSEADLPEDESSRELLEDARRLSEEVSDRLTEAPERGDRGSEQGRDGRERREDRSTDRSPARSEAVEIDVTGASEGSDDEEGTDRSAGNPDDEPPDVDVEAELASIKDEVDRRSTGESPTGADSEAADPEDGATDEPDDVSGGDADGGETDDAGDSDGSNESDDPNAM